MFSAGRLPLRAVKRIYHAQQRLADRLIARGREVCRVDVPGAAVYYQAGLDAVIVGFVLHFQGWRQWAALRGVACTLARG